MINKSVNNWLNSIQNKLLPPRCIFCSERGMANLDICQACFLDLPRNQPCCARCAQPLATTTIPSPLCGRCLKQLPHFDETRAPFLYNEQLRHLITQLKFNRHYVHARLLGGLLGKAMVDHGDLPECIIPVPLHPARYRERGFNQSLEIARHLHHQLKVPLNFEACVRHRNTPHQIDLPAAQRVKNMKNAFSLIHRLEYAHIAIIDDVMTTGATASALALALKQQGVKRVDVWVCARA